nr:MAG TPA: hypothetical protein [Caudoviricetes sp.]DAN84386.1 MAG TPA: hypothetical protein [Caudoviricetes sp.]DAQ56796.1 MAG TPA: hypothetical protein [Caudoviricetes sp.]
METVYLQIVDYAYRDLLSRIFGSNNQMLEMYHTLFLVIFLIIFANKGMNFLLKRNHILSKIISYFLYFLIIIIDVSLILGLY